MTLDRLAQISQKEFLTIGGRFDRVDKRFDDMDGRFDAMDNKFDAMDNKLDAQAQILKEIKDGVTTINFDYSELRTRIERLEKKVGLHSANS